MPEEEKKQRGRPSNRPRSNRPVGRPSNRPQTKDEAKEQANKLLEEYKSGGSGLTEGVVRRRINTLGENPKNPNERWFSFSGGKLKPLQIVDYKKSDPDVKGSVSKVKEQFGNFLDTDLVKKFSELDISKKFSEPQQKSSSSLERAVPVEPTELERRSREFDWSGIVLDPALEELEELEPIVNIRQREISELMDSAVETVRNVDELNQNVLGINEDTARGYIDTISDNIYQRTSEFLSQDYFQRGLTRLIPSESKYDIEQLSDYMTNRERKTIDGVMDGREDEVKTRLNVDPYVEETMKELAIRRLQEVASSVGMRLPPEVFSLGSEAMEQLLENADINIDREDVKDALTSIGVENFEMSSIPFGGLIDTASNILSEKVPIIKTIKNITDKVPESLKNKVIQAGGNIADSLKLKSSERKERKEPTELERRSRVKEEKGERESKYELPSGVSDIFRRVRDDPPPDDHGNPSDGNPQPVRDQRSLLIDEINNINLRLEDLSRGKRMSYPEKQDIKKSYRFPRPDESYSAVPLVQNAMTNYLNDLNLYGSSDYANYNEI